MCIFDTAQTRWRMADNQNLCTNIYTHTCIYMHVYTHTYTHADTYIYASSYTHIHTCIYTHTYNMYVCTHASTPGTTALHRLREELMQTPEALHVSQSITFSNSNGRTSLYPLPETPITLKPPTPLSNIPENSLRTAASMDLLFYTDQHNRVHNSEKVPCSFTMAPCVVVR